MAGEIYWLWLQNALGCCSKAAAGVLGIPGGARAVFEMRENELKSLGVFSPAAVGRLADKSLDTAQDVLTQCVRMGYKTVTPDSADYPDAFRRLYEPPAVVYVKGELPDMSSRLCVAVVGTRNPSDKGRDEAFSMALALAQAGAVIISGAAGGIDTAAHHGAIVAGGVTVAVLGCGIDYPYNQRNSKLRESVAKSGALISEYPPGSAAIAYHFPQRNRLIAALSHAVTVGQSAVGGGSMITARCALEQNLPVYVIDSAAPDADCSGGKALVEDGAVPVTSARTILEDFLPKFPRSISIPETLRPCSTPPEDCDPHEIAVDRALEEASQPARRVYALLRGGAKRPDEITSLSGLAAGKVLGALTELELLDLINALPGKRFEIK